MRLRAGFLLLGLVAIADASPRRDPVPAAKLDDTCLDASCKRHALDHFTEALAQQKTGKAERPLRISYFGDSLTADDHIPQALRDKLGELVGAGGPGFVWAAEPHPYCHHNGVLRVASGTWQVNGISTIGTPDRLLGLGGSAEGSGTIKLVPTTPITTVDVHYLEQPHGGSFAIVADGQVIQDVETAGEKKKAAFSRVELPAASRKLELRARGKVRLFGASLEAAKGIVVDNLGVVNATAKALLRHDMPEHLRNQLAHRGSDLVIVMLGTNEAEWLAPKGQSMVEHEQVFHELLQSIRGANPHSSCLVISPLDQLDWHDPKLPPRDAIPAMVEAQHRAATAEGCAFWDTYDWMGGRGASRTWFQRGWVVKDFQHPTTQGAARIAEALFAGLVR
ncbi:MAG TPA: GDSL-type esterase/lipase family protein [Kofleriaceae bacterium]|nr:GDSL-type esterase/lipase family protein [Kofleriaceae bacterium]